MTPLIPVLYALSQSETASVLYRTRIRGISVLIPLIIFVYRLFPTMGSNPQSAANRR